MTVSHHPEADELVAYASGAAPEWLSLVVACHLTYCAECRAEVELLDDLGGVLLDRLEADPEDGELTDGVTKELFRTGDLSRREEGTAHNQHITSTDPCVALVVSAAPIVPSTTWGKILKALTGV